MCFGWDWLSLGNTKYKNTYNKGNYDSKFQIYESINDTLNTKFQSKYDMRSHS
jgi:hypothetical protein